MINKIKAEIERRQEMIKSLNFGVKDDHQFVFGQLSAYKGLLSFIESLEKDSNYGEFATIKGWVARDRDGALFLHEKYPKRIKEEMELDGEICYWGNGGVRHYIDRELFPDITWADNPVEYELTFHRV